VTATGLLPPEFPATAVKAQMLSQRAILDLTVTAPAGTTPKNFTLERYGADLEPALRRQLSAVDSLPQEWTYGMDWAPAVIPGFTHLLVSLLDEKAPINNHDASTRWCQWARDYVDSL
jgi:hypothetical protein